MIDPDGSTPAVFIEQLTGPGIILDISGTTATISTPTPGIYTFAVYAADTETLSAPSIVSVEFDPIEGFILTGGSGGGDSSKCGATGSAGPISTLPFLMLLLILGGFRWRSAFRKIAIPLLICSVFLGLAGCGTGVISAGLISAGIFDSDREARTVFPDVLPVAISAPQTAIVIDGGPGNVTVTLPNDVRFGIVNSGDDDAVGVVVTHYLTQKKTITADAVAFRIDNRGGNH